MMIARFCATAREVKCPADRNLVEYNNFAERMQMEEQLALMLVCKEFDFV